MNTWSNVRVTQGTATVIIIIYYDKSLHYKVLGCYLQSYAVFSSMAYLTKFLVLIRGAFTPPPMILEPVM